MSDLGSNLATCEDLPLGAYVDGELDEDARAVVEAHLKVCEECRAGFRAHQYFLRELDAAMTRSLNLPVPTNFSRLITARATSEMHGVRSSAEHRKAIAFCLGLALLAFSLLGGPSRRILFGFIRRVVANAMTLADTLWTMLYDITSSIVIVTRVISRKVIVESGFSNLLVIVLAFAILVLSRLILNYHRARTID